MSDYCIGIDLGGTAVKLGLVNSKGEIKDSTEFPTRADLNDADRIVHHMRDAVLQFKEKHKQEHILAVGIGVPGFALPDMDTITFLPNIPVFKDYPIASRLKSALGLPVFVDNDANNAARGEFLFGSAKGIRNFIFVTIGTGVGGGIFINGDLYGGSNNYAGEIGHMTLVPDGRPCGCGNLGCWEHYSSATAMIKRAELLLERNNPSSLSHYYPDKLTAKIIADEARKGDSLAESIFDEAARYTGLGLSNLINVLNPSACIIGGGVSQAGAYLLEKIKKYTQLYTLPKAWEAVEVRQAELGNHAGVAGSAALAYMKIK